MFDAGKNRMIGLPCGENYDDNVLIRFHTIPACHGQTDGQTVLLSISRLTRDKNVTIQLLKIVMRIAVLAKSFLSSNTN